jgi:hypothetical protein
MEHSVPPEILYNVPPHTLSWVAYKP